MDTGFCTQGKADSYPEYGMFCFLPIELGVTGGGEFRTHKYSGMGEDRNASGQNGSLSPLRMLCPGAFAGRKANIRRSRSWRLTECSLIACCMRMFVALMGEWRVKCCFLC